MQFQPGFTTAYQFEANSVNESLPPRPPSGVLAGEGKPCQEGAQRMLIGIATRGH